MLQCPSCDHTLDQDFGMVTCSECKAVLMIDLSGQVQVGSSSAPEMDELTGDDSEYLDDDGEITEPIEEAPEDPLNSSSSVPGDFDNSSLVSDATFAEADETVDLEEEESFEGGEDNTPGEENFFSADSIENDDHQDSDDSIQEPADDDFPTSQQENFSDDHSISAEEGDSEGDFYDPNELVDGEGESVVQEFPMPAEPDSAPVDVTEFANSEVSSLEDGEYLYDITLSRIDSKELREALKFVLMDEKLKLNYHHYLKNIVNGAVLISDLNPIKAKRIVEQLQYCEIDIRWVQKRVVMEIIEPEVEGDLEDEGPENANI